MKCNFKNKSFIKGFTLVEIAIVLLIIGLLIGGILRGQELITSARVRNLIDQKSSVQAAMIGFQDRYKMLAGDLTLVQAASVGPGVLSAGAPGDGLLAWPDTVVIFQNLTITGFIDCGPCAVAIGRVPSVNNTLNNAFGSPLWFSNTFGGSPNGVNCFNAGCGGNPGGTAFLARVIEPQRLALQTGAGISPQVLAEVDRKADDGYPATGSFRQQGLHGFGVDGFWQCSPFNVARNRFEWANPDNGSNCQGAWMF